MAVYTLSELRNKITDRIHENHERAIDGVEFQEILIDILDSLASYTDNSMESPAVNYYVDEVLFDIATGALTLARAGEILPVDISVTLDGRYIRGDSHQDTVSVDAGERFIEFLTPFAAGITADDIVILPLVGINADGFASTVIAYNIDRTGFFVNFDEAVTFSYQATLKR